MRLLIAGLVGLALAGCGAIGSFESSSDIQKTIDIDGAARSYIVHLPRSYQPGYPTALVLVFHGGLGTPEGTRRISGMNAVSDKHGFIAVYPRGVNRHWNDGRSAKLDSSNDVRFIAALVTQLERDYSIDPKRIYSAGISNGAIFSFRLACQLSDFAAVAGVAGAMPAPLEPTCKPHSAVSVLMINGSKDPLVPYGGGMVGGYSPEAGPVISVPQSIAWWRNFDRCAAQPREIELPSTALSEGTQTIVDDYGLCASGTSVQLFTVEGGGHTWPGGVQYLPAFLVGKTSRDFNASETIWQFFDKHPRA